MKSFNFSWAKSLMLFSTISCFVLSGNYAAEGKPEQSDSGSHGSRHSYFVVFTEDGQTSSGDVATDAAATVCGKAGSVFRTSEGGVVVQQGKLIFRTADSPLNLVTRAGRIKLDKQSSCLVNASPASTSIKIIDGTASDGDRKPVTQVPECQDGQFKLAAETGILAPRPLRSNSAPLRVIASEGSLFSAEEHRLNALRGFLLVDAPANTNVSTPAGVLKFSERSFVSIRIFNNTVCIENCSVPNGLDLSVKGTTFHLDPGGSCILSNGIPQISMIPLDGVARRHFTAHFDGSLTAITSEFHVISLIRSNVDFLKCVKCPITKSEKRLSEDLLKGAAAMAIVRGNRGSYCWRPQNMPVYRLGAFLDPFAQPGLL